VGKLVVPRKVSVVLSQLKRNLVKIAIICVLPLTVFSFIFLTLRVSFVPGELKTAANEHALLLFQYSTDKSVFATLLGPENEVLDSALLNPENTFVKLRMAGPNETPRTGVYRLKVEHFGRVIYETTENFRVVGGLVDFHSLQWGWNFPAERSTIDGIRASVMNLGELPIYVGHVKVHVADVYLGETRVGFWLLPGESGSLELGGSTVPLDSGVRKLLITCFDPYGNEVARNWWIKGPHAREMTYIAVPDFPLLPWNSMESWSGRINAIELPTTAK
jgi:hypothetical protein